MIMLGLYELSFLERLSSSQRVDPLPGGSPVLPYPLLAESYGVLCSTRHRHHVDVQHLNGLHTQGSCPSFLLNITMAKPGRGKGS